LKLRWKFKSDEFKGFLDQGTSLTGELTFSGTLRIDGNVHGSINTKDVLVIGEQATIHADIKAGAVEIYGAVFGNIEGTRRIDIYSTGRLRGDIRTPQLVIEDGGVFEGRSRTAGDIETEEAAQESPAKPVAEPPAPPTKARRDREWPGSFTP
jgi:cytoskeletal protein CcmA (bactofilin family)